MRKAGSFGGDALEDVVDEGVHDAHGFAGDTSVRVNLLQHLVDVDSIAFLSLSPSLLLSFSSGLCLSGSLLAFLSCYFGCHIYRSEWIGMIIASEEFAIYNKITRRSIIIRIEIFDFPLVISAELDTKVILLST